ncbi:mitochondrial glutamate carrier 1-like isoform X2 [Agrilus planipennis]|uniref:Mitochondrial glutamate carrier 2 n=1 Tax=Agrilus planipennis TaxID=224129 RepID=A0A7F5R3V6_AGRPL|nr:mitochondrial glutamate carrier 1-like isoform X1 [Agrilus planipennis]XP_025830392.1 mitochondrial glutamate carrier 1-like isoform X2 [Agrilus planipennis]
MKLQNVIFKIANASIAGVIGITLVFPLDLVKTRLQTQQPQPNGQLQYTSMFDCFRKTYRQEGFSGMYKGSGVVIVLLMPEKAIKLVGNDFLRDQLRTANGELSLFRQVLAGMLTGVIQCIVTTPLELMKIQLQNAGRVAAALGKPRKTTSEVIKGILLNYGVFGMYKGIGPTILRDSVFSALYFPLFAFLNSAGPRRKDGSGEAASWVSFASGCSSACVSAWLVTPIDVIKTRLQNLEKVKGETRYNGIADAFVKTLRQEGVKALFRGGACRVMVIAPLFGIVQVVYLLGIAERIIGVDYHRTG